MTTTANRTETDAADRATAVFQALADGTRLRCLALIAVHGELCVCELVHALERSQPMISRHLKLLRDAGLVADRRERFWVHYRLAPDLSDWVRDTLDGVVGACAALPPFAADRRRLAQMPARPGGRCGAE